MKSKGIPPILSLILIHEFWQVHILICACYNILVHFLISANCRFFFVAIADLARGMVGQLISNCWRAGEMQKTGCPITKQKQETKTQTKPNNTPPETKRTSSELSETVKLRFRTRKTLGALRTSPRRHSNIPQVDLYPKLPIVVKSIPAYIPAADKVRWVGSPPCWWMTLSRVGSLARYIDFRPVS